MVASANVAADAAVPANEVEPDGVVDWLAVGGVSWRGVSVWGGTVAAW